MTAAAMAADEEEREATEGARELGTEERERVTGQGAWLRSLAPLQYHELRHVCCHQTYTTSR